MKTKKKTNLKRQKITAEEFSEHINKKDKLAVIIRWGSKGTFFGINGCVGSISEEGVLFSDGTIFPLPYVPRDKPNENAYPFLNLSVPFKHIYLKAHNLDTKIEMIVVLKKAHLS